MSTGIYVVLILIFIYLFFFRIEKIRHEKRVKSIPLRIWINGSRGKSSVARLIAAGLRANGKKAIAKTTGTSARFIINNNIEQPVIRLGMANIREQITTFKKSAREKPDAMVLECMALRPDLQRDEAQIVKPNAVVITNVRADHLDVMGPSTNDIAQAFLKAVPKNSVVFTTEFQMIKEFSDLISRKKIKIFVSESQKISDEIMNKFSYIEHKENVALALDVCKYFGIDEKTALNSMYRAQADPGVLQKHLIELDDKEITLVNAMAANDPDSTLLIWRSIDKNFSEINILINCRDDRIDRSLQMAKLLKVELSAQHYILTGSGTEILRRKIHKKIDHDRLFDLGNRNPEQVVRDVAKIVSDKSLVFAIGNTVGYGEKMLQQFLTKKRGK